MGRSDRTARRQPVSRTIAAIPGRSGDDRDARAEGVEQAVGVVSRWLSVVGWIGIAATSAAAVQAGISSGGDGRQEVDPVGRREGRRPRR